jgi:hypothetical protein
VNGGQELLARRVLQKAEAPARIARVARSIVVHREHDDFAEDAFGTSRVITSRPLGPGIDKSMFTSGRTRAVSRSAVSPCPDHIGRVFER